MKTIHLPVAVAPESSDPAIRQAAEIIRGGGLVAFPTETVYGLGANALDREAVLRIFAAKQRPSWDPIIVHASSVEMARSLVRQWPPAAQRLAERFWPGPLTILLPKHEIIPDACTAGREKVGIRIPRHQVALALIEAAGVPIAAPSANLFGATSPTTASHVALDLGGRIDAILDAGPTAVGVESTVMDIASDPPIIYRPGGVSREQIESVIGPVRMAAGEVRENAPPESLASPGLGIRHYAPRATLVLVKDEHSMESGIEQYWASGERVGLMLPEGWLVQMRESLAVEGRRGCVVFSWGRFDDLPTLATRLYAGLRWLDEREVTVILCPIPPDEGIGLAILDRLRKAAK